MTEILQAEKNNDSRLNFFWGFRFNVLDCLFSNNGGGYA